MSKHKPTCPNCGEQTFAMKQTFGIKSDCHELERKRYAYYKCEKCGCECLLFTPQGKLEVVKEGQITQNQAKRVLKALNLPLNLADQFQSLKS